MDAKDAKCSNSVYVRARPENPSAAAVAEISVPSFPWSSTTSSSRPFVSSDTASGLPEYRLNARAEPPLRSEATKEPQAREPRLRRSARARSQSYRAAGFGEITKL